MISLQALVQAVQTAVVEAADQVRLKNISILREYFVYKEQSSDGVDEIPLVPRMIEMEFPDVTAKGPSVHSVQVPLISIAPPDGLYLAEFRLRMKVEFDLSGDQGAVLRVAPARPSKSQSQQDGETESGNPQELSREFAEIEILIKHGDKPSGLTDVIQGYDRALRAEIPG